MSNCARLSVDHMLHYSAMSSMPLCALLHLDVECSVEWSNYMVIYILSFV